MTLAQFLAIFPEFTSFDQARITFWLSVTANLVDPTRWGALAQQGQALLTAHYLTVDQQNQSAVNPGQVNGAITSKSVAGVSVTKDTASVVYKNAGDLNMTNYGIQFSRLARMMGAGAIQAIGEGFSFPGAMIF
ncbi:MAG: DUF4054 domain-containing protein [Nitrospirota bacterium]|nr:DUF4054 domain-containing protein [Nitrospirota bacterium]